MKKRIMLICAAGMSTSLLVNKMKDAAVKNNIDVDIFAVSAVEAEEHFNKKNIDAVLLGPQIRFMKAKFEEKTKKLGIGLNVIPMVDYGTMNGEKVLKDALALIG